MKRICLICIWMGRFHDFYPLWYLSASRNPTVDFYIISDQKGPGDAPNIHYIDMTFENVRDRIQALFPFKIELGEPYKLCDYRPVWGKAFPELVEGYDFWGYCDTDLIFGDIRKFVTDEMMDQYDRILEQGNFTLWRNTEELNNLYQRSMDRDNMAYPYRAAFRCRYPCYFDEFMGMNILGWKYCHDKADQTEEKMVLDFGWQKLGFTSYVTGRSYVCRWTDGRLYRYFCDGQGRIEANEEPQEYMLVHVQKRSMDIGFSLDDMDSIREFWIVPNRFTVSRPEGRLYTDEECREYAERVREESRKKRLRNLWKKGILAYIPHYIRSRRIKKWIVKVKKFY